MKTPPIQTTNCLRCGALCRTGTPDPTKKAIHVASKEGFCADCMVERFLLSIEPIRAMFEGTPKRPAMHGPEIFLDQQWRETTLRPVMKLVLAHTQMPEDAINWLNVVSNWGMAWPAKREPGMLF